MSKRSSTLSSLSVLLLGFALTPGLAYATTYQVTLDTRPLAAQAGAAPYSLEFQLVSGSSAARNSVTLGGFHFGSGGGPSGQAALTGGAAGTLAGQVALTDTAFLNEFIQGFTPSPSEPLTFTVDLTNNAGAPIPDSFAVTILDRSGAMLRTAYFAAFVRLDFTAAPALLAYASDRSTPPPGCPTCPPINLPAPGVRQVPERIVFSSNRAGNFEIYSMNADGSGVTRLTSHPALDLFPAWSPDRSRITFTSDRDGNAEIYSMNADGSGVTRLTFNSRIDGAATWSPDGARIAFTSTRDGNLEIYSMNADGSGLTRLTNNRVADTSPAWSPDGTKIAFTSTRDGNVEIYTMNVNGTGVTRLTNSSALDLNPAWSPDGRRIAFSSNRASLLNFDIWVMNADGSSPARLTTNASADIEPAWSRDGARIVFTSNRDSLLNSDIYVMNSNGTGQTRLTTSQAVDSSPQW